MADIKALARLAYGEPIVELEEYDEYDDDDDDGEDEDYPLMAYGDPVVGLALTGGKAVGKAALKAVKGKKGKKLKKGGKRKGGRRRKKARRASTRRGGGIYIPQSEVRMLINFAIFKAIGGMH